MSQFPAFTAKNGPAANCQPAVAETLRKYTKKLPPQMIEFWKESGWCSYANGLIWIVNPEDFADLIEDWDVPKGSIVFGRTAFGDLFLWSEKQVQYLFVHQSSVGEMTDDIETFMDMMLCNSSYKGDGLMGKQFQKIVRRLGPPAIDECYAFVPALALGGDGDTNTVERVKLREHLGILAELAKG
jgi:hypothetical protein